MPNELLGIFLALMAAGVWGVADFSGGYASRKVHQFQTLFLATITSLALLGILAAAWGEVLPSSRNIALSMAAGICGVLGLAALYKGLSSGNSALVAPIAAVVGAVIPMLAGILLQGLPTAVQMLGFGFALAGIWLVSREGGRVEGGRQGLVLGTLAGVGFGGFLMLVARIDQDLVFTPLAFSKIASIGVAWFMLRRNRLAIPRPRLVPAAVLTGLLDAGGNALYMFSTQYARLDIAAVLSSLYPAGTVLLSIMIFKEKVSVRQWIGVGVCILAVGLITG